MNNENKKGLETQAHNSLQTFLTLCDQDFELLELHPNSKKPCRFEWQKTIEKSTKNDIISWFNRTQNLGVKCGNGLVVIDLDIKNDGINNFKEVLANLAMNYETLLNSTMSVATTSGGVHLYFKYDGDFPQSLSKLAIGVDIKSKGGQVVAPGSNIDGSYYTIITQIINKNDLPVLPEKLSRAILNAKGEKVEINIEENKPVPQGQRNQVMTSKLGALRQDLGLGYDGLLAMAGALNGLIFDIPLPDDELQTIAWSVAKYPVKTAKIAAEFDAKTPNRIPFCSALELTKRETPVREWVMRERYCRGYVSALCASGGTGKTRLAMLDAYAIASGKGLSGFAVPKKAKVLIYNTEDDINDCHLRSLAINKLYADRLDESDLANVLFITKDLLGDKDLFIATKSDKNDAVVNETAVSIIIETVKENDIALFMLDPFVNSYTGLDENSNTHMNTVIKTLSRIAKEANCAVALVHHMKKIKHEGKEDASAARGASAVIDGVRISYNLVGLNEAEIKADKLGIDKANYRKYVRLIPVKNNLFSPFMPQYWFTTKSVELENEQFDASLVYEEELTYRANALKFVATEQEREDYGRIILKYIKKGDQISITTLAEAVVEGEKGESDHVLPVGERKLGDKMKELYETPYIIDDFCLFTKITQKGKKQYCKMFCVDAAKQMAENLAGEYAQEAQENDGIFD